MAPFPRAGLTPPGSVHSRLIVKATPEGLLFRARSKHATHSHLHAKEEGFLISWGKSCAVRVVTGAEIVEGEDGTEGAVIQGLLGVSTLFQGERRLPYVKMRADAKHLKQPHTHLLSRRPPLWALCCPRASRRAEKSTI